MSHTELPWTARDSVQLALEKLDRALKLAQYRMSDKDGLLECQHELKRALELLEPSKSPVVASADPQLAVHPLCDIVLV